MSAEMSTIDLEFVKVPVSFKENGVFQDPTADLVQMAFMAAGSTPGALDWVNASWETAGSRYLARALVGPTAKVLTVGTYIVWVKITDSPEIPAKKAPGFLKIF